MRACPFCAEEIQDAAVVCKHCDRDVPSANALGSQASAVALSAPVARHKSARNDSGRTTFVLLGIALASAVFLYATHASEETQRAVVLARPYVRPAQIINIANEPAQDVGAGHYLYWEWAPNHYRLCHVEGRVVGLAGGRKDVDVVLFDEDNFLNWKNGHDSKDYFASGHQTAATIDVRVPGDGKYFLVISNVFSTVTDKSVQLQNIRATCSDQ
jgi:hypothetical protein